MLKFVSGLLVTSVLVGIVGCGGGGSSSSDPGNAASNEETRSIIGSWEHDTNTEGTTCIETWAFENDGIGTDDYQVENIVDTVTSTNIGTGVFVFDTTVTSGERHSLLLTVVDLEFERSCDSSPYDDNEPVQDADITLYLEFTSDTSFNAYLSASSTDSLGTFTKV